MTTLLGRDTIAEAKERLCAAERASGSPNVRWRLTKEAPEHMSCDTLVLAYCDLVVKDFITYDLLCGESFRRYDVNDQLPALAAGCAAYPELESMLVKVFSPSLNFGDQCIHLDGVLGLFTRSVYDTLFNRNLVGCWHPLRMSHRDYLESRFRVIDPVLSKSARSIGSTLAISWAGTFDDLLTTTLEIDRRAAMV
jgi:hypothetical protein